MLRIGDRPPRRGRATTYGSEDFLAVRPGYMGDIRVRAHG
jgi:hypothetical protein